MKRSIRLLLRALGTVVCAASLLLCALLACAWLRSYWSTDMFERSSSAASWSAETSSAVHTRRDLRAVSSRGSIAFTATTRTEWQTAPRRMTDRNLQDWSLEPWPPTPYRYVQQSYSTSEPGRINLLRRTWYQKLGFNARAVSRAGPSWGGAGETLSDWAVRVPHWFLVLLTALPTFLGLGVVRRAARRSRRKRGLCANCGYDLRATTERCPECGIAVENNSPPPVLPTESPRAR